MKEKVEQFLKEWEIKDNGENSYIHYRYIEETGKEIDFEDELYMLFKKNNFAEFKLTYIGGFDSPGYELSCYCLSIVEDNQLYTFPINFECY